MYSSPRYDSVAGSSARRFGVGPLPEATLEGWEAVIAANATSQFLVARAAVRRMLAYECTRNRALVLAAGVPEAWVREAPGVRVRGLRTHHGVLDFTMCADGDDRVKVSIGGAIRVPEGGIVVESPYAQRIRAAVVDGEKSQPPDSQRIIVHKAQARIVLEY